MARKTSSKTAVKPDPKTAGPPSSAVDPPTWSKAGVAKRVHHNLLVPSDENPRLDFKLDQLCATMKAQGQLYPLIVRPHPRKAGCFEIRDGERRWRAAGKLKWDTLDVIVRELTDAEAMEVTLVSTLEHEVFNPLEKAKGYQTLYERGWDDASIAARFGITARQSARARALNNLSEKWRKRVLEPKEGAAEIPSSFLECVAPLAHKVQDEMLAELEWDLDYMIQDGGLNRFRDEVAKYTLDLAGTPWALDDPLLDPKAGPCNACPKRSNAQPLLFDEEPGKRKMNAADRCLDKVCYEGKRARYVQLQISLKKKEAPGAIVIAEHDAAKVGKLLKGEKVKPIHETSPAKKTDPDAVPAIVADGPNAGAVKWVKLDGGKTRSTSSSSSRPMGPPAKPKTLKERQEMLEGRRCAHVVDAVREQLTKYIEGGDFEVHLLPKAGDQYDQLLSLLAVFGTGDRTEPWLDHGPDTKGRGGWRPGGGAGGWDVFAGMQGPGNAKPVIASLYRALFKVWHDCCNYFQVTGAIRVYKDELPSIAELLKIDLKILRENAEHDIPTPRTWAKLKADGTPKEAGKSGAKFAKKKSKSKAAEDAGGGGRRR